MNLFKYPENKRLTKSRSRNRILLGLTTLGLTIGALSFTTKSQNITRQSSSFSLTKNSQRNKENLGLKTTHLWCPHHELNLGLFKIPACVPSYVEKKPESSSSTSNQEKNANKKDSIGGKLTSLQKDSREIKETLKDIKKTQEDTKKILEEAKKIQEETKEVIREIADAYGVNKSPETKTKKKTGGSSRTRKRG